MGCVASGPLGPTARPQRIDSSCCVSRRPQGRPHGVGRVVHSRRRGGMTPSRRQHGSRGVSQEERKKSIFLAENFSSQILDVLPRGSPVAARASVLSSTRPPAGKPAFVCLANDSVQTLGSRDTTSTGFGTSPFSSVLPKKSTEDVASSEKQRARRKIYSS